MSFDHLTFSRKDVQPGRVLTARVKGGVINQLSPAKKAHARPVSVIVHSVDKVKDVMFVEGMIARNDGTPRKGGTVVRLAVPDSAEVFVQWNDAQPECAETAPAE